MAYLASTRIYHLPILSGIGLDIPGAPLFVDPQQEQVYAQTVENQLYGIINMHNGGHGVIEEGDYTNVSTTAPIIEITNLKAFINQIYVDDKGKGFVFSGITPAVDNYLFLELIETLDTLASSTPGNIVIGDQSSRVLGNAKTVVSTSPDIGPNSILISRVFLDAQGYGYGGYGYGVYGHIDAVGDYYISDIDLAPPGKIHLTSVLEHAADNTDPHGPVLIVDQVQSSGVGVAGTTTAQNVTVLNNLFVQASQNPTFLFSSVVSGLNVFSNLEVFGPTVFSGQTFVSALTNGGDATFNVLKANSLVSRSTSTFVRPVDIQSGGRLGNTLQVGSGITIDGIDVSSLKFLTDGSEADNNGINTLGHTHNIQTGVKHIFLSPEFEGVVRSGIQPGTIVPSYDTRNNFYRWNATQTQSRVVITAKHIIPEDFVTFSGITVLTRTSAALANTSGIIFSFLDTTGNPVRKQFIKRPSATVFSQTRFTSGIPGVFTQGGYFGIQADMVGENGQTVDLSEIVVSYNSRG